MGKFCGRDGMMMLVAVGWWKKLVQKRIEEAYIGPSLKLCLYYFSPLGERETLSNKVAHLRKQYIHNGESTDSEAETLGYQAHHLHLNLNMKEVCKNTMV